MARTRSPNYPAISIGDAITAVTAIHAKDLRNKMSREAVSHHLGYKSVNGRSLGMIAALRAYGLIEGKGDELRVTAEAVSIIADPPNSKDRQKLLAKCAWKPKLFSEVNEYYEGDEPSESNLRSYLIKQDFTSDAANKAVAIYLDNYALVSSSEAEYHSSDETSTDEVGQQGHDMEPTNEPVQGGKTASKAALTEGVSITVSGGRVIVEGSVDAEGLERLRKKLEKAQEILDLDE